MFSVLEISTVGSTSDMLTPQSIATEPRTEQAMPQESSHQPSYLIPILICSTTLWRGTEIPLWIHAIGSNSPLLIVTLINPGVTGKFTNINYVWLNNLHTQHLPRAIPIYNGEGTLNEAGYITKVVDLIFQYKGHSEKTTFHVMGIGQMTIILSHMWLMEHNPEINCCTGNVSMTQCHSSCRWRTTPEQLDWLIPGSADNQKCPPKTKSCQRVHIKEVSEDQPNLLNPDFPQAFNTLTLMR